MEYSTDQLILAAHVRALALELWREESKDAAEKMQLEDSGKQEFIKELAASKTMKEFILKAMKELEITSDIMLKSLPKVDAQG